MWGENIPQQFVTFPADFPIDLGVGEAGWEDCIWRSYDCVGAGTAGTLRTNYNYHSVQHCCSGDQMVVGDLYPHYAV